RLDGGRKHAVLDVFGGNAGALVVVGGFPLHGQHGDVVATRAAAAQGRLHQVGNGLLERAAGQLVNDLVVFDGAPQPVGTQQHAVALHQLHGAGQVVHRFGRRTQAGEEDVAVDVLGGAA